MSRSNYDKPFFVDVGTSIAAVRCQSNRDVVYSFCHTSLGRAGIEMAEKMCERMNAEVDRFIAEKNTEIDDLRGKLKRVYRVLWNCASAGCECENCRRDCDLHKMGIVKMPEGAK